VTIYHFLFGKIKKTASEKVDYRYVNNQAHYTTARKYTIIFGNSDTYISRRISMRICVNIKKIEKETHQERNKYQKLKR